MTVNATAVTRTAKLVVAAGAIAVGALALGTTAAHADDAVGEQAAIVEQQPTDAGDQSTAERRKGRVFIIGKTTKPHARQG
jgi:hypothetical protein